MCVFVYVCVCVRACMHVCVCVHVFVLLHVHSRHTVQVHLIGHAGGDSFFGCQGDKLLQDLIAGGLAVLDTFTQDLETFILLKSLPHRTGTSHYRTHGSQDEDSNLHNFL